MFDSSSGNDTSHAVPDEIQDNCLFLHVIFNVAFYLFMKSVSHFLNISLSKAFIAASQ